MLEKIKIISWVMTKEREKMKILLMKEIGQSSVTLRAKPIYDECEKVER